MSTINDVDQLVAFVAEFYREMTPIDLGPLARPLPTISHMPRLRVKSLHVYPIKSCGGYKVPPGSPWEIRPEGLAWDREWCVMHLGTGKALSQKQYPKMALLKPTLDFEAGLLRVAFADPAGCTTRREISVPLSADPNILEVRPFDSQVCGDTVVAQRYISNEVNDFLQTVLGVPCALARFPSGGSGRKMRVSTAKVQKHQADGMQEHTEMMPHIPPSPPDSDQLQRPRILLSNESAMLMIYAPSVDEFNKALVARGSSPITDTAFRANVVLEPISGSSSSGISSLFNVFQAQRGTPPGLKALAPYSEDFWQTLTIGAQQFELLGACRRCHMVCVNQDTAERNGDVFVTLAKTRRFEDGKAYFGIHMRHADEDSITGTADAQFPTVSVGDEAFVT
jgi:molybdenum cofactor sulfurtransferase